MNIIIYKVLRNIGMHKVLDRKTEKEWKKEKRKKNQNNILISIFWSSLNFRPCNFNCPI